MSKKQTAEEPTEENKMLVGARTIRLPNGQVMPLADTTWYDLRSAFVVQPWSDDHEWMPFSYGRAENVPGTNKVKATAAHTNLPRTGAAGLPHGWQMFVCRWRASANAALATPLLEWAAETAVDFAVNDKRYASTTLVDLLLGGQPIASPSGDQPVYMRSDLRFESRVRTDNEQVIERLRKWLRGDAPSASVHVAVHELETIAQLQQDALADTLRRVAAKLQPGRDLICWLHIEGPLVRPVV